MKNTVNFWTNIGAGIVLVSKAVGMAFPQYVAIADVAEAIGAAVALIYTGKNITSK